MCEGGYKSVGLGQELMKKPILSKTQVEITKQKCLFIGISIYQHMSITKMPINNMEFNLTSVCKIADSRNS